ncbi:MAG: DUF411 domain-containing protein [Gammaproteobacteria bacterium]|nr:DUF411 domain-containing protein [Gammaproteobacteria bacterium]
MKTSLSNLSARLVDIGKAAAFVLISSTGLAIVTSQSAAQSLDDIALNVYKEETCGCCVGWIEHMKEHSFESTIFHPKNLNSVKAELGIKTEWQSCHTAVTEEGFLFEGHIPAKFIVAFLAEPPANALGLAVPGMPIGGPGMEMGDRFTPYDILLMKKDGSSEIFASIKSKADQ